MRLAKALLQVSREAYFHRKLEAIVGAQAGWPAGGEAAYVSDKDTESG